MNDQFSSSNQGRNGKHVLNKNDETVKLHHKLPNTRKEIFYGEANSEIKNNRSKNGLTESDIRAINDRLELINKSQTEMRRMLEKIAFDPIE